MIKELYSQQLIVGNFDYVIKRYFYKINLSSKGLSGPTATYKVYLGLQDRSKLSTADISPAVMILANRVIAVIIF